MKKLCRGHWQMREFIFQRQGMYFDGKKWDLYRMVDDEPVYLGTFKRRHLAEYHARKIIADEIESGQEVVLWKLYLRGRKNEYKLLGFVWARSDIAPNSRDGCTKWRGLGDHLNLCADRAKNTDHQQEWWMKPWPKDSNKGDDNGHQV